MPLHFEKILGCLKPKESAIKEESARYLHDAHWTLRHLAELSHEYCPEHGLIWIAVVDGQVVARGPDLGQVRQVAVEKTGLAGNEIFVHFLEGAPAIL